MNTIVVNFLITSFYTTISGKNRAIADDRRYKSINKMRNFLPASLHTYYLSLSVGKGKEVRFTLPTYTPSPPASGPLVIL